MTRGRGMLNGGYRYLGGTVETYGNITLSDSMEAIRKVVFEEKRCTLQELVEALDCDFREKRCCSRRFLTRRNLETIRKRRMKLRFGCMSSSVRRSAARKPDTAGFFLAVLINNNMNVTLGQFVGATPDGRNAHKFCPTATALTTDRIKRG